MMRSNKEHEAVAGTWYGHSHFDYRFVVWRRSVSMLEHADGYRSSEIHSTQSLVTFRIRRIAV